MLIGGICYGGILLSFGNDNSTLRMRCICIGVVLVTGMLYDLVRILEVIGHRNIIHFFYYDSKYSRCSGSRSNMIGISNGNVIGFLFSFLVYDRKYIRYKNR